jgi:probable HAF family extracellular repeat protein
MWTSKRSGTVSAGHPTERRPKDEKKEEKRPIMFQLRSLRLAFAHLVAALTLGAPASAQVGYPYTLTDLGSLGGNNSQGYAVNVSGQVTGTSYTAPDKHGKMSIRAFLSGANGGPLVNLGTIGGTESYGYDVNDSGQVAGSANTPVIKKGHVTSGGDYHAFLSGANGGALKDLGTLGGSYSYGNAVNTSGQVTGYSSATGGGEHAFLSGANGGALVDLGTLGGNNSYGYDVNDSGQVTGHSFTTGGYYHAFLSGANGGALKDLGTLGGNNSRGNAVNVWGQVAGVSVIAGPEGYQHAFLSGSNGGPLVDLGTLGGTSSYANDVNASGQVVGDSALASGESHPFLYSNGTMYDLNSLIAPGSGFSIQFCFGISDNGFITGNGYAADGSYHAFLLTPTAP